MYTPPITKATTTVCRNDDLIVFICKLNMFICRLKWTLKISVITFILATDIKAKNQYFTRMPQIYKNARSIIIYQSNKNGYWSLHNGVSTIINTKFLIYKLKDRMDPLNCVFLIQHPTSQTSFNVCTILWEILNHGLIMNHNVDDVMHPFSIFRKCNT